jgi:hypothetical protein
MKLDSLTETLNLISNNLEINSYLELGVEQGFNFCETSKKCKRSIGVDIKNQLKCELPQNASFFLGSTNDFFSQNEEMFDFILIDASHSHEDSLRDFINSSKYLNDNGLIVMHDSYPANKSMSIPELCGEVYKTVIFIKQNFLEDFECFTFPFHPGITLIRKIKKNKQVSWT